MDPPSKPRAAPVKGKTLILAILGGLLIVVGLIFWAGMTGGSTHEATSKAGVGFAVDDGGLGDAAPSQGGW